MNTFEDDRKYAFCEDSRNRSNSDTTSTMRDFKIDIVPERNETSDRIHHPVGPADVGRKVVEGHCSKPPIIEQEIRRLICRITEPFDEDAIGEIRVTV